MNLFKKITNRNIVILLTFILNSKKHILTYIYVLDCIKEDIESEKSDCKVYHCD